MTNDISLKTFDSRQAILMQRVQNTVDGMREKAEKGDASAFGGLRNRYFCLSQLMEDSGIDQKIIKNYDTQVKLYGIKAKFNNS